MQGIFEVYEGDSLKFSESNLIVDGAGEIITDIFSTTTRGIEDNPDLSSILDTSNYTIQAISFGKPAQNFYHNLHDVSGTWQVSSGAYQPRIWGTGNPVYYLNNVAAGSNPQLKVWTASAALPLPATPEDINLSEGSPNEFGQNPNAIQFSSVFGVSSFQDAVALGCYAPSGGLDVALSGADAVVSGTAATNHKSIYNISGSMDKDGFINIRTGTNPYGTFIMSATSATSSTGEIAYITQMNGYDINMTSLYGGIFYIGLWALDLNKTLKSGNIPPYANNLSSPVKKFKLFAKKALTKSLTGTNGFAQNNNSGASPQRDLKIVWRVKF